MGEGVSILSTKTLGADAKSIVGARGWTLIEEDFIAVRPLHPSLPDPTPGTLAVFTSENGVIPGNWPVACVSGRTLEAVRAQAMDVVCTAPHAKALAQAIIADGRFTKTVFFCALDHRPELTNTLRDAGIPVQEVPVYETICTPKLIAPPFDAVLFFSPSGVDSFFQVNRLQKGTVCFPIG
jgi:uroporphyrinogen-III synthase